MTQNNARILWIDGRVEDDHHMVRELEGAYGVDRAMYPRDGIRMLDSKPYQLLMLDLNQHDDAWTREHATNGYHGIDIIRYARKQSRHNFNAGIGVLTHMDLRDPMHTGLCLALPRDIVFCVTRKPYDKDRTRLELTDAVRAYLR